jgi:cytochrome P450
MGSRSCVGKHLATVELYLYISQFFRYYDAELLSKTKPWRTKTQWFSFQQDLLISMKKRDHL